MKSSRFPTLFFVIFLMFITPLTPMASAVEGRAELLGGNLSYQSNTVEKVVIVDTGTNNLWGGDFYRSTYNYVAFSQSSAGLEGSQYHTYIDDSWDKSVVIYDDGSAGGNNLNWSIVTTNLDSQTWFSSMCILDNDGGSSQHTVFPIGPASMGSYCINQGQVEDQLEISKQLATFPEGDINIQFLENDKDYLVEFALKDCTNMNNVLQTGSLNVPLNSTSFYEELSFPNHQTGNYTLTYELFEVVQSGNSLLLDSLTTGCSGEPPNGGGPSNTIPSIDSSSVTPQDSITGLMSAQSIVSNLTANTNYDFSQKAYEHVQNQCGFYGNNEPLIEVSGTYTAPSNQATTDAVTFGDFVIGANWTGADPVELHFGDMYCYAFEFQEADDSSTYGYQVTDIFGPSQTPVCTRLCWDYSNYAPGASFSPNAEWATYSHLGMGEIIGDTPIPETGKWYWEYDIVRNSGQSNSMIVGIHTSMNLNVGTTGIGTDAFGWGIDSGGYVYHESEAQYVGCSILDCWDTDLGVTIGIAVDMDDGVMWYSKNGIWPGSTGSSPDSGAHPVFGTNPAGVVAEWDDAHGNNNLAGSEVYPAFSVTPSSGNSVHLVTGDILTYEPPEGFAKLGSQSNSTDSDGDGLPDSWESNYGLDPGSADTDGDGIEDDDDDLDGDGLSNMEEYDLGTNPNNFDTDGDSIDDSADVFPLDPLECCDADADGTGNNADFDDDNDEVPDFEDCSPLDPEAWVLDENGVCGSGDDNNEIEFCYDYLNKDLEDSYATEITCTEAGFMWSTDELKNLDISLDWEWGDYNNDGIDTVNLEVSVEFPTNANGDTSFTGLHQFKYILQITNPENNQLLLTHNLDKMIDLESDTVGIGEFIEHNFPNGDLDYCIHVEIREQASTDTVSLDGICENMNVEEAQTSDDDLCYGPGDYLIVQNSIESTMNGRYFPSVGYQADPNDMTKIIEGEGDDVYWYKGENLDGSEGFGWAFYLAHLLDGEEKWVALQGTNPPQDLESEVDHLHEPWGDDSCKPDGYDSNYGHITYHEESSSNQPPQLQPDILWNPNEEKIYLDLHVSIEEDSIDQVIVYFDVTSVDDVDNFQFDFSGQTGIMNLDSNGQVSYNYQLNGFESYHTYCFEFNLEDVATGDTLERSTGCMLISDNIVDSQEVDWESDVNGGSTSVTSIYDDEDGTKAIDDDFDTQWTSGDNCVDEWQEITIELHNSPTQEYQLISGVSLKWGELAPNEYNIFALDQNSIWKELATVDMDILTDPEESYMLHHLFQKIEASKIKITCTDSDSNIQLIEVQVHSWFSNQGGGPTDGIMDAYYLDDLTEGAQIVSTSQNLNAIGNAIDNDYMTYWESDGDCPQDVMIDLGEEYFIGAMKIDWATIYDSYLFNGEVKVWNEQDGWNQVMNLNYLLNEQSNFFHFYPMHGQKIMFKCADFDLNLKISEFEIFEAKSNWYNFDFDNDGKNNGEDSCYFGESDWVFDPINDHDNDGCFDATEDWDDDNDGINDEDDSCPKGQFNWDSWSGDTDYDHDGCYDDTEDVDDDNDGRTDVDDDCLLTRLGAIVDDEGCETSFPDQDNDGVADSYDHCSQTPNGTEVDSFNGCPIYNDMDGDGVPDQEDAFPEDSSEQFDDDNDGVGNNADTCPNTLSGDFVDSNGCVIGFPDDPLNGTNNDTVNDAVNETVNETANETAIDTDGDGVNDFDSDGNVLDECPDTEEGLEVNDVGCSALSALPPQLAAALDFILNIDSLLGLPDGTLEIMFAALGMMFGVIRFVGRRTLAGKSRRVEKYTSEIRLARSRRELENLERRITKDNEKNLLPPGGFGDLMELIETRAIELGEMDMASHVREVAAEEESMRESHERMLEEMEGTREAVAGLQDELSQMRRKGPPSKGRGRKGPPRRGSNDSGYKIKESGGPRRPSLHPADLDGDGFVTAEERRIYRERQEQEDDLW